MPLTYQDCKDLQEAGFPQEGFGMHWTGTVFSTQDVEGLYQPTLSELIKECGEVLIDEYSTQNLFYGFMKVPGTQGIIFMELKTT